MYRLLVHLHCGELKLLEGSAKIISFIARDESQHLTNVTNNY